jgi:hypothetical protein
LQKVGGDEMAKYVIQCLEVVPCMVVVEAPSREAAESFYEMCDGSEFERSPPVEHVGPPSLKEIGWGPGGMYSLQKGTPFIGKLGSDATDVEVDYEIDEDGDTL